MSIFNRNKTAKELDILNYELNDDGKEYGGISFMGETVADFIAKIDANENITLKELNKRLKNCGICPIKV